ncbi:unnamed protein product [Rotaria sordida]|uniref:BED-type domain-containing protein n=1 Tax=Rotaria sordida TaxID=392033 RepID=A0A815FXK8_9BILA|nr:unnamed protein product [Rotaria sordida]CAF3970370.1 unnamed protein product [Rotaria sordida]
MNISPLLNIDDVIELDSSPNCENVQLNASSSNSSFSSIHLASVSGFFQSLYADKISSNLKLNKKNWMIVDVKDKKSDRWKCFGIPARKIDEEKSELFEKFVSCKHCYITYSYSSSTRNMNKHIRICNGFNYTQIHFITSTESNSLQLINTSTSSPLISSHSSSSNNKSLESHKKMTNLLAEWICSNARPPSIVEDTGLKNIIEEAIRYTCGTTKSEDVLSCRKVVHKQIKSSAASGREQINNFY